MRCHILNNATLGGSASRLRIKNLFDKWVKQLEIHKTKLSIGNKDGAFRGKVKCSNAKWEISDKVSGPGKDRTCAGLWQKNANLLL